MAQRLVRKVWSEADQTITFKWYVGKDAEPVPMLDPTTKRPLVFRVGDCPEEQKVLYMLHGATQKASDGFSSAEADSGGDINKKKDLIARTIADAIALGMSGIWREKGEGVEREPAQLYEAMSRAYSVKFPDALAAKSWLATQSGEVRKGMSKVQLVANAILDIKKENNAAKPAAPAAALAALEAL